ncbi:MAG TPA: GDP-L-fucose synthase [Planctomycetota bacterium]|nr:GDP-L-fucose synthase [Planctomycetota bacterium]
MNENDRIFVAGHRGLVGGAILRALQARGCRNLITAGRSDVDLREQAPTRAFFADQKPQYVFLAAAKVGGILANDTYPADFLYDNLAIEANVVDAAFRTGVAKLLLLGSSCIYPRLAPQPIAEEALLTGPLEPTNEWYAIAKIAGIKLCQAYRKQHGCNFIAGMPTNLYGPGDNFDLKTSHVLPALMRKIHEAKAAGQRTVTLWGSGTPRREFLYVDDCADACLHLMQHYDGDSFYNIGCGEDLTIAELARLIAEVVGFQGEFVHDTSKPDGMPRKMVDSSRIFASGWRPKVGLREGVERTYRWYVTTAAAAHGHTER